MKLAKSVVLAVIFLLVFNGTLAGRASSSTNPSTSASADSGRPIPATFFGVSVLGITSAVRGWPLNVTVGTLGKTQGTEWLDLEPSNGTYNWARLDNAISAGKSAGITSFIYTFRSTPEWASSEPNQSCNLTASENVTGCAAPPTNINDWDNFVRALVTRYKGEIQYYELWNEANLQATYSGTVSEMVVMAQHAYDDIKSIDPAAIVISPSVSGIGLLSYSPGCKPSQCWLAEYLQAGGGNYSDEISFHDYACFTSESACVQTGVACPQGEIEECAGSAIADETSDLRSLIASYGLAGRPIIDTEGGIPSDIIDVNLTGTVDQQTAYAARWFIMQASENISVAVWFSEFPAEDGLAGFGTAAALQDMNRGYEQVYDWLVGSSFSGPCSLSGGLWTCDITSATGQQGRIVWADTNSSVSSYSPPSQFTDYQDLNGTVYRATPGSPIALNEKPVFLESGSTSSTTSAATSTSSASTRTVTVTTNSTSSSTALNSSSTTIGSSYSTSSARTANNSTSASETNSASVTSTSVNGSTWIYVAAGVVVVGMAALAVYAAIRSRTRK